MSFTQTFGGTTIYPSDVSYLALALTANTTLEWPLERGTGSNLVASIIDITPTGAFNIVLPSALLTGVGQTVLFNNLGPSTVTVKGSTGSTLLSLASGEVWQIYLTDNTTAAGVWRAFKYGASTAQAQASALAGYGLVAIGSVLAQASTISSTSITPQTLGAADRASTYIWTGGLGTFNLPSAIVVGNGWFFNVRNSGTGDLTLDPAGGELINGSATIVLSPNDSAVIATDGTSWYTIGLGQQAIFAFDFTSINLAGLGNPSTTTNYTLSGTELNRIAYTFTGTPLGNINIVVPFTVQQYWMSNATGGSFILSLSTLGGTTAQIAQNARAIYYCTGSQIVKADTSTGLPIPVVVAQGGTGATNANDALTNLGGTVVGKAVFTAASESAARTAMFAAIFGANSDITSLSGLTTPLSVAQGGTGLATLTANAVLTGNGTSAPGSVAPGTAGNLLTSNGTIWTSSAAPAGGVTSVSGGTTGLTPSTPTGGAVVLAGTLAVANGGTGVTTTAGIRNAYGVGIAVTKTGAYTAVAGDVLACDTIAIGAFSITLPASPTAGDKPIVIFDAGTTDTVNGFATNNLTVLRNGSTVHTLAQDVTFSTKGVCVTFEYVAGTWRLEIGR